MIERIKERLPLVKPLFVPTILYIGLIAMAVSFVENYPTSAWRVLVLLTPMIPGTFLAFGIVRVIRQLDEMNRKIILESTATAFAITLFLNILLGLLEIGNVTRISSVYTGLFMVLAWLAAKVMITRRYE